MQAKELSAMPLGELEGKLDDAYRGLFNLRFQRAQGQLANTNALKAVRRDIARIKTVLRQRELAQGLVAKGVAQVMTTTATEAAEANAK